MFLRRCTKEVNQLSNSKWCCRVQLEMGVSNKYLMTWKDPWLLRGWRLVQWSVDLVVFLAHSLLSQYSNWQQMTCSPAPDSSTLRTPGSLEDLASLCQRGRGDLSCTWGVFGVQLVFFSGMQIQMSSMCKDRGVICSQGGIYVWPEAPTLTSMCREKVYRWRSLGDDGVVWLSCNRD